MNALYNGVMAQAMGVYTSWQNVTAGQAGVLFLSAGLLLGLYSLYRKKFSREARTNARRLKGERKAMDIRQVRLREILTEIIADGLLDRGIKGELSLQEEHKILKEVSAKLDLPDLISTKSRSKIIKQEIKARRAKGYNKPVKIPGPKIGETTSTVVKVARYWRSKAA